MELQDMTREQLMEYIQAQKEEIKKLKESEITGQSLREETLSLYEGFEFPYAASSIGLIITDTDGTIISFNKTIQELLGAPLEEYRNTNVIEIYANPNDRAKLMDMLAISNSVRDFEVEIKQKDGTLRSVYANVDCVEMNRQRVLLTSIYDISQYKEYKDSEHNYQKLFSSVPVGITVTDTAGHIILGNNAVKELLGYESEEFKDLSIRDFYYTISDRQQILAITKKLGVVRDFETCFRHKDGRKIHVLINLDRIEFYGRSDMMLTSIRDISHLKRMEDELVKERDFSNTILNTAAILIVVVDRDGVITRFNHACEKISGYSFEEIHGLHLWETKVFDPAITKEQIDNLLSNAYPKNYETVIVSRNGERFRVSWTFAAMRDENERLEYIIATGNNVTKRYQIEEDLKKANLDLAARVKDMQTRTNEMNQINELGELLQSCRTSEEACSISARYIQKLCPASSGALYLINSSRNLAEAVEMWGEPVLTDKVFAPLSCWAIRRGRQHLVDGQHPGLLCDHVAGPETGQYLCVPLTVNGEAIGILHMNNLTDAGNENQDTQDLSYTEHKTQVVTMVAEHIALALSNLKLRETLRQQSIRDALTGLFNRRYMEETLERELGRAQRENVPVGLIMFDIDHFKNFNDLAGHDGGDALLRELGVYLNTYTRGGDIVCRYGGEEFLAVLPGASLENARQRAEQMRKDVSEMLVYHLGKPLAKCTISLGVSVYPENGQTSKLLLKAADDALYRAKNEGRNRVVVA